MSYTLITDPGYISFPFQYGNPFWWNDVDGFENVLWATRCGLVKGVLKILTPQKNNCGYYRIETRHNGDRVRHLVHKVIARTFMPNFDGEATDLDHIDRNKQNNAVINLEWVTHRENIKRKYEVPIFIEDENLPF